MESVGRVKKSLRAPIKRLTSCVSTMSKRKLCAKRWNHRARGTRGRGGYDKKRNVPLRRTPVKYPSVLRSYQADLEKERKLREATNAQKNAERAAMRAHFRRKYQLAENSKDTNHLRCAGGKVSLPRELSKLVRPDNKMKDDSFNLLNAFQGLRLGTLTGSKNSKYATTATPRRGRACQVM
ncbi:complexin-3-like [Corythoichthys intestinalis]|uniref:complexin-3-like n=1 Tax=Corythoichthys intestinalis TaxID=161448 RepID=UPI0025A4E5D7|nr:complexin-3-like [Corythoichthys intestinalis]XP_057691337.1 complexin-3-like [Corythoichthys intestinalis]XP_061788969.1 complexin-3-like [Nerophis lumbriciformis]